MKDDKAYIKKWPEMAVEPDMCSQFYIETVYTNSVTSNFYPNETLTGCPFFFTHFWNRGTYKTLQHVISCTAVKKWFPNSKSE